ncbi:N-(5'-phosphoribosyl)anthranilate isomerase [Psychromarinibacter sp. C21-152]|uniref:N-(5'-phosphoribosyl)anthranilate isomerase n=1 Tax=Psychromarinibacter sediminicola TaxID=3033385 RepID=A0AAE3T9C4_9RHOB|nr:N-(5'-phosphoribosyl)anthranilate isomerase [Psychromarinibacter sediminicola]MDF0600879.1 N-(5'-phosphoribosyl)anthranilate isomerase [Psychromarinibacter sediminicola]
MRQRIVERPLGQDWMDQIFRSRAAMTGGVVRRRRADVEREIGLGTLELEVRRRGFHMIECGDHLVIACCAAPVKVIC